MMYKAVPQSVLLYGSTSEVETGENLKVLEGFQHWAAIQIMEISVKYVADREWEYPLVVAALEAAGLHSIQGYIQRRQVTLSAYVACCTIYELCTKVERRPGKSRMMRLWDQEMVNESED